MSNSAWAPLLEGGTAVAARSAIREVADELVDLVSGARRVEPPDDLIRGGYPGLSMGSAGIGLFLHHLSRSLPGESYGETATALTDAAIDALPSWPLRAGLYGGFTGVAWTVRHLGDEPEDDLGTEELDGLLLSMLERPDETTEYDLISGLVGVGVYGAEALPHRFGRRCLERVVERLDSLREDTDRGVTWFTPPERVPESQRSYAPHGYYNLGVAHGVPAVLVLLALCCRVGVAADRSRRLLRGGVDWLLAQRQEPDVGSCYPSWIGEGIEPRRSRLAWCYGDPGVGGAVLAAGQAVGEPAWEEAGLEILRHAARRDPSTSQIRDAGLCHGSAGLAHVFNRAYQATGDEELRQAALHWFRHTLESRRPGEGVAGYLSWEPDGKGGLELRGVPGFLTGASGVGLALLAAVTDVEPTWDRVLALSVPAEARAGEHAREPVAADAAEAAGASGGPGP